jgi:hypothetical protein
MTLLLVFNSEELIWRCRVVVHTLDSESNTSQLHHHHSPPQLTTTSTQQSSKALLHPSFTTPKSVQIAIHVCLRPVSPTSKPIVRQRPETGNV